MSKVLSKPHHSQIVQTLNMRRGRLLPFAHNSVGIITHCNINCDKNEPQFAGPSGPAECDSIGCGREHCAVFTPTDKIRSAVKDALIHPRPFSGNVTVTQEKLKNLKMLRSSFVKACPKKLSSLLCSSEKIQSVCGVFPHSGEVSKRTNAQLVRRDLMIIRMVQSALTRETSCP